MGRVKDFYWDQICAAADNGYGPEPDDLEMLRIDAEQARQRYLTALKAKNPEIGESNVQPF